MFKTISNETAIVSSSAMNRSVLITGMSGCGKTYAMKQIEKSRVAEGQIVIVLDYSGSHSSSGLKQSLAPSYDLSLNRIVLAEDGLCLNLFSIPASVNEKNHKLQYVNAVGSIVEILGRGMGRRQKFALRKIVERAFAEKTPSVSDSYVLESACKYYCELGEANSEFYQSVYDNLWEILELDILKSKGINLKTGALNIVDYTGLNPDLKSQITYQIMVSLWQEVTAYKNANTKYCIALDECQNVSFSKGSITRTLLTEGRKYDVSLLLATQTLGVFPPDIRDIMFQAATTLYFKPTETDIRSIAGYIDSAAAKEWRDILSNLERGECVGCGSFEINGMLIHHPLILKTNSMYDEECTARIQGIQSLSDNGFLEKRSVGGKIETEYIPS